MKKINIQTKVVKLFLLSIILFSTLQLIQAIRIDSEINHRFTIVNPYVTEQEMKRLRSKWAQVISKNGYKAITSEINNIIKENNLDAKYLQ